MGIHRRSLYDTFGDKHELFLKAVERYEELLGRQLQAGIASAEDPKQALRFMLDYMIEGYEDKPPGCLLVNMAVELAPWDSEVDRKAGEGFGTTERLLADLIRRGQEIGQFLTVRDAGELAEILHNTMIGIRVLARTSAGKDKLRRIADSAMVLLDL